MNEEEKTFSLKDQLQKVDQSIRNLFFDHEKKEASFEERVKKYNNLIPLLRKEIKEKDFDLSKYIKAIESEKANLKKMIQDIVVHDKGSEQTTEAGEDDDFVTYGEPDSPENMKKKYKI